MLLEKFVEVRKVKFIKRLGSFRPVFDYDFEFRGTVKNMILHTEDFKIFRTWNARVILSEKEVKELMKNKKLIYLKQPVKIRASSDFIVTPGSVFYKNIVLTADPENDYLKFLDLSFPAEGDEVDLDFIVQKVKELYPDIVTELPKKPLEELSDEPGFHGTYHIDKNWTKRIITARGAIIIRKGYEDYPKDLQKYIDYVLGLRDADKEIIQTMKTLGKPQLFIETAGAIGGAEITIFRDSYKGKLYYNEDDPKSIGEDKERTINFPWGPGGLSIKTDKKNVLIYSVIATKKGLTVDTLYLDGRWKITVPWDYTGPNPLTVDAARDLPPEITKEPVYIVPKAEIVNYHQEYFYITGILEYDKHSDVFRYTDYESDREIKLSKDVLEAGETIEEAVELQRFLQ